MDQELIAYFERKFDEIDRRFDDVDRRFGDVDRRLDETREQQRADLDAFRQEVSRQFEQVDGRFARLEADVRQTNVALEGQRGEIQLVAEGVANVNEKLERFRDENAKEHEEIRSLIKGSYSDLDQRVTRLEKRAAGGRAR
jgi:chromosome segregation ATPase